MDVKEEHNAGKEPYKLEEVHTLLTELETVVLTSGKKILEFVADKDDEELLKKIMGRSGNLRAPSLLVGTTLYVGYNEELYGRFTR